MRKLSKRGLLLLVSLLLIIVLIFTFLILNKESEEVKEVGEVIEEIIVEDAVLKVQLLELISNKNSNEGIEEQECIIEAKEEIAGVNISKRQIFTKSLALVAPNVDTLLFGNESTLPSHNAYILVLIGDVVKYRDTNDNVLYRVENARIQYYIQPTLVETAYNSIYIISLDREKEKMVKTEEYKEAMSNIDTYMEMLQW